jgi:hypothetical protein
MTTRPPQISQEHEFEPQYGLPERLPAGEKIVWQGSPVWQHLAREVFHVRKLTVYFAAILMLRAWFVSSSGAAWLTVLYSVLLLTPLFAAALGFLYALAYYSAKTTVYTITDKRVVMRVGIVLSVTYNLPFKEIFSAGLAAATNGTGNIALALKPGVRIAYLQLWPHVRPWVVRNPQPLLRSVANANEVASLLAHAWADVTGGALAPQRSNQTPDMQAASIFVPDHARRESHPVTAAAH